MPRPSKRVAPDTLGGKLRTARQNLHLSLADVAGGRYSTSLISQIERNRVDPSAESLQYLADRLQLSHEELQVMARQHRESETEATFYREYETKYAEISQMLAHRQSAQALKYLEDKDLAPEQLPLFLRWRILALRGQAYFEQREFAKAQRDFQSSLATLPTPPPGEYVLDVIKLRLHMAEATRELNQFEQALEYYREALKAMDTSTSLRYIAEAHWGMALVYYNLGRNELAREREAPAGQDLLQTAWQHAEKARILYDSTLDNLNADLLQCQMAQIEQAQGKNASGKARLQRVLTTWQPVFQAEFNRRTPSHAEHANVVSAAACYLADIACQERAFEEALAYVDLAAEAGQESYRVRRAEAFLMKGLILESRGDQTGASLPNPAIEECYRRAVEVLEGTGRWGSLAQAHTELGRYLLSIGRREEGHQEMERARRLVGIRSNFSDIQPPKERSSSNEANEAGKIE